MQDKSTIDLVSAGVSGLWITYYTDSLGVCLLKYFLNKLEDEEIRHILELALNISNGHLQVVTDKFNREDIPIPKGFTDEDININAPQLFTDPFYLFLLMNMAQNNMNNYTLTLSHISRPDLRDFFSTCIEEAVKLFNLIVDALEQQGLYIKSPRVEFTKEMDYIDNQSFFSSGLFGKKRRLMAREITTIFASLRQNIIGGALITGFGQVAESKEVSDYFFEGRDIAWKKVKKLNSFFIDENLPTPSTSDSFVKDSTIAPFSDKLMMNMVILLHAASIGQDGIGLSNVMRHDLHAYYSNSIIETSKYAEDGLDIMVENKWLEQHPIAVEHRELKRS